MKSLIKIHKKSVYKYCIYLVLVKNYKINGSVKV